MLFLVSCAALFTLVALAGVIYPFKPFRKRWHALATAIGCFLIVGIFAPAPEVEGPQQTAAIRPTSGETPEPETAAIAKDADETARQQDAQDEKDRMRAVAQAETIQQLRDRVETMRWADARSMAVRLDADGGMTPELRAEFEATTLKMVRPLPADARELNRDGYALLAVLAPENEEYTAKIEEYDQRIAAARRQAVARLRGTHDKVENIYWYQHPNAPKYLNSRSTAYLYIGKRGEAGRPTLRLKVQYTADDWLFVNRVIVWHDGIKETLAAGQFKRDHNSTIWEWTDVVPSDYQIEILRSMSRAREVILRFEGDKYHRDKTMSAGDKRALAEMIEAYEVMRSGM